MCLTIFEGEIGVGVILWSFPWVITLVLCHLALFKFTFWRVLYSIFHFHMLKSNISWKLEDPGTSVVQIRTVPGLMLCLHKRSIMEAWERLWEQVTHKKKFLQGVLTAPNHFKICINNYNGFLFLSKSSCHIFIVCNISVPVVPVKEFRSAGSHAVGRSYLPLFWMWYLPISSDSP